MKYQQMDFPGKTDAEKRRTEEYKKSFLLGMSYAHGVADGNCINIVRNLGKITLQLVSVFMRDYSSVRMQMIKNGIRIYPTREDSPLSQAMNSMRKPDGRLSIKDVFNDIFAPDFMSYIVGFFGGTSDDGTAYVTPLSVWANPQDWQEFPKWLEAWGVSARVEEGQLICDKNDTDVLFEKGVHTSMIYNDSEVLLHNKLTLKKDTSGNGPQYTREYKRSILCSGIYLHGVVNNDYVDLVRNLTYADSQIMYIIYNNIDWVNVTRLKNGLRVSAGAVKQALKNVVKMLQIGEDNQLSLKNAFGCIYAPNFMKVVIEHFAVQTGSETEIAIDMSWGNPDDLQYYPNWLQQYEVRARIDKNRLYCNKEDISKLLEQCIWMNDEPIKVEEKPPRKIRQYHRLRIKKDSSGRNNQTRDYKRFVLIALIYLRGKIEEKYIDIDIPIPEEADQLMAILRDNDWVSAKRIDEHTIRLKNGQMKTALPGLLKKIQMGREKAISLKRVFNYLYAPVFMHYLMRRHARINEKNRDETVIDLSWAYQPDLPEYVRWLKVWGVEARVDGSKLICRADELAELEKDGDYIAETAIFESGVKKYAKRRKGNTQTKKHWQRNPRS